MELTVGGTSLVDGAVNSRAGTCDECWLSFGGIRWRPSKCALA